MKIALFSTIAMLSLAASAAFAGSRPHSTNGTCYDGETETFIEQVGDDDVLVTRVCKNGSFYPASKPFKHATCSNGQREVWIEQGPMGDDDVLVTRVCKNGSFYPKKKPVAHIGCKNGQRETWTSLGEDGDRTSTYVCRNGKFVRIN